MGEERGKKEKRKKMLVPLHGDLTWTHYLERTEMPKWL
jgi:hypothetical protein